MIILRSNIKEISAKINSHDQDHQNGKEYQNIIKSNLQYLNSIKFVWIR